MARLFGLFENPLTNLQAYHDRVKLIFSFYRTDPNTFFSYYSDFLVNAHNIFCEVRYVDPIVANKVDEMQQDIRWRGAVWYRTLCVTVSGCWNWLEDDVQKAIKNYDGHDVATVHGQERFDEIMSRYPPTGISYNSWDIGQILHRWDPTSVESNCSGLFQIEDAITEARLYRLAKEAVDAYYRASYIKDHDKVDISYAEDNLGKDPHGAFCRARDALSNKSTFEGDLSEARASVDDLAAARQDGPELNKFVADLAALNTSFDELSSRQTKVLPRARHSHCVADAEEKGITLDPTRVPNCEDFEQSEQRLAGKC